MDDSINTALRLTNAVRNALNGDGFSFAQADYIDRVDFRSLPREKSIFGGYSTTPAASWYNHLEALGLIAVYADFDFYSKQPPVIYCEFSDGAISEFGVTCSKKRVGLLNTDASPDYVDGMPVVRFSAEYFSYDTKCANVTEAKAAHRYFIQKIMSWL